MGVGLWTGLLLYDAVFQRLMRWKWYGHAAIVLRIVHQQVAHALVRFTVHFVPAPDKVGTLVIKTDVHEIVVPGLGERIVLHFPFAQLFIAMGISKGLFYLGFSLFRNFSVHFFTIAFGHDGSFPAIGRPALSFSIDGVNGIAYQGRTSIFIFFGSRLSFGRKMGCPQDTYQKIPWR